MILSIKLSQFPLFKYNLKSWQCFQETESQPLLFRILSSADFLKDDLAIYIKYLKVCMLFNPVILLLGIYFKEMMKIQQALSNIYETAKLYKAQITRASVC